MTGSLGLLIGSVIRAQALRRRPADRALLAPGDAMVLAITSDVPVAADVPCLTLSNIHALADFVLANARVPSNA
jgi:hypothetical protein